MPCALMLPRGSPPHVRGKVAPSFFRLYCLRITPACAGKSSSVSMCTRSPEDHPRMCGEKGVTSPDARLDRGSPPHVRGKGITVAGHIGNGRITPAYAGKRPEHSAPASAQRDHPRMCGEKGCCKFSSRNHSGSPPHVRGKACGLFQLVESPGITPACAGKRSDPLPAAVPAGPAGSCPASRPSQFPPRMTVIKPRP